MVEWNDIKKRCLLPKEIYGQDGLVCLFALWVGFTSLCLNDRIVSDEKLMLFTAALLVYFCARSLTSLFTPYVIAILFCIGGLLQASVAWGQYVGLTDSNHICFSVTGTFLNPAPLAAFLGLSLISCAYLWRKAFEPHNLPYMILYTIFIIYIGGIFILALSRAAWVALAVVVLCVVWRIGRERRYIFYVLLSGCLLTLPFLYQLKRPSADGRLFIWNVSTALIREAPVCGKGADSFAARYMLAQADYFKRNPQSPYRMQATDNIHAFNEYLRMVCEYGLVGISLFFTMLYVLFRKGKAFYLKLCVLFMCIFACFSYISEVPVLLLSFCFLAGVLSGHAVGKPSPVFNRSSIGLLVCLVLCVLAYAKWHPANECDRDAVMRKAKQLYGQRAYSDALPFLQRAYRLAPVSEVCMDLGNCYFYLEGYPQAEYYLSQSRWMVPGHILPRYYLFRLYWETGKREKAKVLGNEILNEQFKKEGSVAMEVKHYIKECLDE